MSDPVFLTTREVAELLRLKERKVYALAASGALPCRKLSGKLLFPRDELEAIVNGASLPGAAPAAAPPPPDVVAGSHDPLLDWAVRESGSGLALIAEGSGAGLARMLRGGAVAAGMHLLEQDGFNTATVSDAWAERPGPRPLVLVEWARRRIGLLVRADGPVRTPDDLAGHSVVARQEGSGGASRLEALGREGVIPLGRVSFTARPALTEAEAAQVVARGGADAAYGLEAMALQYGLGFIALGEERFDLLVDRAAYFEPPMQALLACARGPALAEEAAALGGYDITGAGTVHWNAP